MRRLCARAQCRLLGIDQPLRVGRYTLKRMLGAGSHGIVYEAFDPQLERVVALKLLRTTKATPRDLVLLRREASTLAKLADPELLPVFDVGVEHSHGIARPYLVTGLVRGVDLVRWAASRPARRRLRELLPVAAATARALDRAHRAGVVHRDIKPEHILVDDSGGVKLIDFGLSVGSSTGSSPGGGTTRYAAPELLVGAPPDRLSDLFSLCVTLWEAAFSELPSRHKPVGALPPERGALSALACSRARGSSTAPRAPPRARSAATGAMARPREPGRRARRDRSASTLALRGSDGGRGRGGRRAGVELAQLRHSFGGQCPHRLDPCGRDRLERREIREQIATMLVEGERAKALRLAQRRFDEVANADPSVRNPTELLLAHMYRENGFLERAAHHFSSVYFESSVHGRSEDQLRTALEAAMSMVFIHAQGIDGFATADRWVEHGRATLDRLGAHGELDEGRFHNAVGALRAAQGRYGDAIVQYREAIEVFGHDATVVEPLAAAHANLGIALATLGRNDEGAAQLREALRLREASRPPGDYVVAETLLNLGAVLRLTDPAGALAYLQRGARSCAGTTVPLAISGWRSWRSTSPNVYASSVGPKQVSSTPEGR